MKGFNLASLSLQAKGIKVEGERRCERKPFQIASKRRFLRTSWDQPAGLRLETWLTRFRSAYWNGILAADEDEDVDGAYDLFSQMKETGLTVEPFMYTTMIHMLEKHGQSGHLAGEVLGSFARLAVSH